MATNCQYPSCAFIAKTEHAMQTHICIAHSERRETMDPQGRKRKRRVLSVPKRLQGTGARLPIDRITGDIFKENSEEEPFFEEFSNPVEEPVITEPTRADGIPITMEQTFHKKIAAAFLVLGRSASEKMLNSFITVLKDNHNHVISFLQKIKSIKDVKEYEEMQEFSTQTVRKGFEKRKLLSSLGMEYTIYWKDPVEVLTRQLNMSPRNSIINAPTRSDMMTHPMNAEIGNGACRLAERYIKSSTDVDVCWKTMKDDGEQSFVGGLQLFTDKSQTSLRAGALTFYPLHVCLVNFTEEVRRSHIVHQRTIVAYLPVRYDLKDNSNTSGDRNEMRQYNKKRFNRAEILSALHESMAFALQRLKDVSLVGFFAKTEDGYSFRVHLLLVSYVADTPEAEDMLSVKRGTMTCSPCHRCLAPREHFSSCNNSERRKLSSTLELIERLHNGDESVLVCLNQLSMLTILPALSNFPLVGIHPSVDLYAIFRFEPMHNLSLGVSKLLKECLTLMLKDDSRRSLSIVSRSGQGKQFKQLSKSVLQVLNQFLRQVEQESPGYGLHLDYSKGETNGRLSGFFTDTGIIGMLEARDYDDIDRVAPFLGAMVERFCRDEGPSTTKTFTLYSDMVDTIYRRRRGPGWCSDDLINLQQKVSVFKTEAVKCFEKYQRSGMRTSKFHSLDHLIDDLRCTGGIEYLHGGLYEQAHKGFKSNYALTSRRSGTAMDETLSRDKEREIISLRYSCFRGEKTTTRKNPSKLRAVKEDGAYCVTTGKPTTLHELKVARQSLFYRRKGTLERMDNRQHVQEMCNDLGDDGVQTLINLIQEKFAGFGIDCNEALHIRLELPSSAHVSGYNCPTLKNQIIDSSVRLPKSSYRISQRVVGKANFFGLEKGRHDDIMIENGELVGEDMSIWFGKALTFVRFCIQGMHREGDDRLREVEFCFVQYYEILTSKQVMVDKIDETLDCIRLRWQRSVGEEGRYMSAKEFGLIPVDSIRGIIHVVNADVGIEMLEKSDERRREYDDLRKGEDGWAARLFYVNRFYHKKEEDTYDFIHDFQAK